MGSLRSFDQKKNLKPSMSGMAFGIETFLIDKGPHHGRAGESLQKKGNCQKNCKKFAKLLNGASRHEGSGYSSSSPCSSSKQSFRYSLSSVRSPSRFDLSLSLPFPGSLSFRFLKPH